MLLTKTSNSLWFVVFLSYGLFSYHAEALMTHMPSVFLLQATAPDKERQVFRRGRHQNVSTEPCTTQPFCSLHVPHSSSVLCLALQTPSLSPTMPTMSTSTPESEDFSGCSSETVCSPALPLRVWVKVVSAEGDEGFMRIQNAAVWNSSEPFCGPCFPNRNWECSMSGLAMNSFSWITSFFPVKRSQRKASAHWFHISWVQSCWVFQVV